MLLHPDIKKRSIADVAQLYDLVPSLDGHDLNTIEEKLLKTRPKPYKLTNVKVKNWLRRQRVYSMIFEQKGAVEARNLLGDRRTRRVLQYLIMADTPRELIPGYCAKISGVKPSKEAVKLFEHYFWKRDNLALHEWAESLKGHPDKNDLLSSHERGPEYALWKLGYREDISPDKIVKGVLHEATMRFFETSGFKNDRNTAMTAKMWSETIFKSLEELNKSGDAVQEILDELKQISIRLEDANVKTIEELTGGNHSRNRGDK